MRAAAVLAAALALAGSASAATPVDPFDALLAVCAAKNPQGVAAAMNTLGAAPISPDEADLMRGRALSGYAIPVLVAHKSGGKPEEILPVYSEVFGWRLDRAMLTTASLTSSDGRESGRVCSVAAPYDHFDAAVAAMGGVLAYGVPQTRLDAVPHRIATWEERDQQYAPPGVLLMTSDFGGGRGSTSIQFITQ
ncbi:hypothetical protein sos41_06080 [Alphaproteobacteria bacterium SO-S41]|nr:hypothetical protein sos41_06080 [Alphaproteobacteria bacterium SO-S41]